MKSFVRSLVIASALAAPAFAFAQESGPAVQSQQSNAVASGYGGSAIGNEQAGSPQSAAGHLRGANGSAPGNRCAGPVSYCDIFFGS